MFKISFFFLIFFRLRTPHSSFSEQPKIFQNKEWRGEISETEPARLSGLIWRSPNSVSIRKPIKNIELKSLTSLKLGTNGGLGKWKIEAEK